MRPLSTTHCSQSEQPCLTLSEYLWNSEVYFTSNTTFHFLPGTHSVNETRWVNATNVTNLQLIGRGKNEHPISIIECNWSLSFMFVDIIGLKVADLEVVHCGLTVPLQEMCARVGTAFCSSSRRKSPEGSYNAALFFFRVQSLVLKHLHVVGSVEYGLLALNTVGNVTIYGCKFLHTRSVNTTSHGGNAVFLCEKRLRNHTMVNIQHSEFAYGIDTRYIKNVDTVVGGGLRFYHSECGYLNIRMHECSMHNNIAPHGGNMFINADDEDLVTVEINSSSFQGGRSLFYGGGLHLNCVHTTLTISNSIFTSNSGNEGGAIYINLNRGTQYFYFAMLSVFVINVDSCTFRNNSGLHGGGVYLLLGKNQLYRHQVSISKSIFINNDASKMGSALIFTVSKPLIWSRVAINNCSFIGNTANARPGNDHEPDISDGIVVPAVLYLYCHNTDSKLKPAVQLSNVIFTQNKCAGIYASGSYLHFNGDYLISANNKGNISGGIYLNDMNVVYFTCKTEFLNNTAELHGGGAMYINVSNIILFNSSNVTFIGNRGGSGAIYINQSNNSIHFQNEISFISNHGHNGGSIAFSGHQHLGKTSRLQFHANTTISMIRNHATKFGGGIYITEDHCNGKEVCFFHFEQLNCVENGTACNISIILENNTAGFAGDLVYGGCLETCYLQLKPSQKVFQLTEKMFYSIFHIHGSVSPSAVASSPRKVCFCSNQTLGHGCSTFSAARVFQGEQFYVYAMAAGQFNYASPAVVRSEIIAIPGKLGERQNIQELPNSCGTLTYSIQTSEALMPIQIFVESPLSSGIPPAVLHVTFLPCPLGFKLSAGNPPKCDCVKHIRRQGITCNITTQTIHRPAEIWIGNISDGLTIHTNCPFDYCKPEDTELVLDNQDEQCSFNRTGILCGACPAGLSLALGSSKCLECSNIYILLIIPFAVAGVALVFILLKCNLTVSTGTINGLIFYANIVQVNRPVFFPSGDNTAAMHLLSTLIAWLNLDLGIQMCFCNGMTVFASVFLQFVFPVYIWALVCVLICVSRYSTTFSTFTGRNTISALATLLLLSYAKLLRTIIAAVSFTTLTDGEGSTFTVWLADGNISYMKWPHTALFLASVLAFLLYLLPFTLLTLLAPCLQARSKYQALNWVNRLKPLLDTYQGPYKNKFRYWTGLMLVVRVVLFIGIAANVAGDPKINLLAVVLVTTGLLTYYLVSGGNIYRKFTIDILDWYFLINVQVFATATIFLRSSSSQNKFPIGKQAALTLTMVGSAFVVFLGIVIYHCYQELRKVASFERHFVQWKQYLVKKRQRLLTVGNVHCSDLYSPTATSSTIELRECLLTDT